jgi:hypothetical protein
MGELKRQKLRIVIAVSACHYCQNPLYIISFDCLFTNATSSRYYIYLYHIFFIELLFKLNLNLFVCVGQLKANKRR